MHVSQKKSNINVRRIERKVCKLVEVHRKMDHFIVLYFYLMYLQNGLRERHCLSSFTRKSILI